MKRKEEEKMKKIIKFIVLMCLVFMFVNVAKAQTATTSSTAAGDAKALARVTTIGQKILSANNLPTKVTFVFSQEDDVNAYANIDNEVHVYKGLLDIVETDDELAGVIGHEIGHIVNSHIQKQTIWGTIAQSIVAAIKKPFVSKVATGAEALSMLKLSRSAEYEADLTGVDLMIGAGYNPQGMLSLLNKIAQNYIDVIQTHPSGNKRLENVYDYINFNYPAKLKPDYNTQSYKQFKAYINTVIAERNADPKKMASYVKKETKLREQKLKRAKEIRSGTNPWASVFNVLQSTAQFSQQ